MSFDSRHCGASWVANGTHRVFRSVPRVVERNSMPIKTKLGAATLAAGLVAAVPAPALAHGGPGDRGRFADVPSRIATKLTRAEKALDRAQERADDGNVDGAVAQLAAVRRNLASAEKSAVKRTTADSENGPAIDE